MKKKVIYTCITGDYDDLIKHKYVNSDYDYVCFTDNKTLLKSKIKPWKILPLKYKESDKIRNARWHKTHPHILFPKYSESVWVDGTINIPSKSLFKRFAETKQDILIPIHFVRTCIYEECATCIECKKDSKNNIDKVIRFLDKNKMPKNYGLLETNIIFRRHNNKIIKKIDEEWWNMIKKYSYRDQLSMTYVLWKNGIIIDDIAIPNNRFTKREYSVAEHIPDRVVPERSFKIFTKRKVKNGRRHIYLFGIKIASYKRLNKNRDKNV